MRTRFHHMLDSALAVPGIRDLRMQRFDADFSRGNYNGTCRGVYHSYAEAAAAAPTTLLLGYDHAGPAGMYRDRIERVSPGDYPMMLWLQKAFAAGVTRVVDLGGHVGVSYYAYQKYLDYPDGLRWQVFDVPAVAAAGCEIALERDPSGHLSFIDSFAPAAQADLLFTSGCVQYLEQTLAEKLAALPRQPEWLLVNLLPLHDSLAYWTVQSIGKAFCPCRIQHKASFFSALEQLGYQVLDVWTNAEKQCEIAFAPEHSLNGYVGAALRKTG
ncbi:putative methyltransferase (TIGR04325 family) [Actimicrobium sp. GrIS 1.19]|uniref:methyltransferase, TIGR04325 family n=1 Tax=Actimicrobium sp. GrIS 1.19 TaxID=3071708 RepID=UPI002E0A3629|nr:putative methyltransferase (TIGR04325 family) [Actimicrobium sp. GrIS 1.19]